MKLAARKMYQEMAFTFGVALLAVVFYVFADFTQTANPVDPGPAFFPKVVAIFTIILCVGNIISLLKKKDENVKEKVSDEATDPKLIVLYVLGTLLLTVVYILLFETVNYMILTGLFVFAIMFLLGVRKWKQLISVAVLYAIISYLLYAQVLQVPLH